MGEPTILICYRVADMASPPTTSRIKKCGWCDMAVWVARSSPATDRIRCIRCMLDEAEPGEELEVQPLTAEQREDIAKARRRG